MGRLYDATYGRLFAAGYDWMLGESERAGLGYLRRDLVARAAGRRWRWAPAPGST